MRHLRWKNYRKHGERVLIDIVITDAGVYRDIHAPVKKIDPYFLLQASMFVESFQNSVSAMSARLNDADLKNLMQCNDPDAEESDMPICTAVLMALNKKTEPFDNAGYE